ncbi:MAG: hypothetical protein PW845_10995 [Pseudomonas sp.]|uniref:PA1571 family protein n=1 Tax=Pseudomonas abieticivorans TaxID=2931382 RepID=UPI0020BE6574|nr:PA1571 family protein [Pseudomonas sp. PIA16]MDE1165892.1 hypothetical protein [Pseudomonas sp.]
MGLQNSTEQTVAVKRIHPHEAVGGSIIDAQGQEVPITEDMIQDACQELEKRLVKPSKND